MRVYLLDVSWPDGADSIEAIPQQYPRALQLAGEFMRTHPGDWRRKSIHDADDYWVRVVHATRARSARSAFIDMSLTIVKRRLD